MSIAILNSFVAAASIYGGIAPKHLAAHLGPVLDGIAESLANRNDYGLDSDEAPLVLDNIVRAVDAANADAVCEVWGDEEPDAPMILLTTEQRPHDVDNCAVRITYGGGRTYASLLVYLRNGICEVYVGAYPSAMEFDSESGDVLANLADIAASIERRRAATGATARKPGALRW